MPRPVAYDYLVAASEAWPFASEAAFRLRTLELRRRGPTLLDEPTSALAQDLEQWLRPRAGSFSLESLRRIFEYTWFPTDVYQRSLAEVLVDISTKSLEIEGHSTVLKRDHDLPARLAHARWLSLLLPPDLLIAARAAHDELEPPGDAIHLCTPQLGQILRDQPVAETHLHLGAAFPFSLLWSTLLPTLGSAPPPVDQVRDSPFGDARTFIYMLSAAAVTRLLLAAFLRRLHRIETGASFAADFAMHLDDLAASLTWPWGPTDAAQALQRTLNAVVCGGIHPSLSPPRLAALHRALFGRRARAAETLSELLQQDPLGTWLAPAPGRALPETRLMARALSYLISSGRADAAFATLFWQYQRVRGATYRYLVQEPGTPGLDWFSVYFNRLRPFRKHLDAVRVEVALEMQSRGVRLGALEGRIGPEPSWPQLRKEIRDSADQAARFVPPTHYGRPEVAILLHLIKVKERGKGAFRRLNADPSGGPHGVRFGAWGYECLRVVLALETALAASPELLVIFRGLDIASNELAVPTWPIVPLFARMREASKRAAAVLHRLRPEWNAAPFRVTCHAGEDYGRLVEGLRRVHELIEFGVLRQGDRIGHGLCLGDNPERLARRAKRSPQPAEERLDDLLWELDRYASGELSVDSGRFAYVRAEALRIGREIYAPDVGYDDLVAARRLRHDPRWLERLGYPYRRHLAPVDGPARRLAEYLRDEGVFRRGQALVEVTVTDGELAFLNAAQAFVRREVARLEITVESNPSSNLLVGDYVAVEEHPSFRMAPLSGRRAADDCALLLSINTDDPITFASSLSDEYAHLYGALLRSSVSASETLAWLDARRQEGFNSRFTNGATVDLCVLDAVSGRGSRA